MCHKSWDFRWILLRMRDFLLLLHSEFDLFGKRATVFRYSIKLPQTTISVINEGCQLTPYRGVSIGGIRQYHAGCGNPDGIELFIKSASRLFFQSSILRAWSIIRDKQHIVKLKLRKEQAYGTENIDDKLSCEAVALELVRLLLKGRKNANHDGVTQQICDRLRDFETERSAT